MVQTPTSHIGIPGFSTWLQLLLRQTLESCDDDSKSGVAATIVVDLNCVPRSWFWPWLNLQILQTSRVRFHFLKRKQLFKNLKTLKKILSMLLGIVIRYLFALFNSSVIQPQEAPMLLNLSGERCEISSFYIN